MMRTQLKTISVTSLQIMLKLIQSQVLYLIATILTGIQTIIIAEWWVQPLQRKLFQSGQLTTNFCFIT